MKKLFTRLSVIISILVIASCSKDELYDNILDDSTNIDPPKTLVTPPIYKTSIQIMNGIVVGTQLYMIGMKMVGHQLWYLS